MRSGTFPDRAGLIAATLVIVASIVPDKAGAQVASGGRNTTINTTSAGYLGILQLKCDCTLRVDPGERFRFFVFRSDPVVVSIEAGSPAGDLLRNGDQLVRIDGAALRSAEGARKFASVEPGQKVNLTILRDGRTSTVSLTASGLDWSDRRILGTLAPEAMRNAEAMVWSMETPPRDPAIPRATRAPVAGVAPRAPVAGVAPPEGVPARVWVAEPPGAPPATPAPAARPGVAGSWSFVVPDSPASPEGWFGFSFRCTNCGWARSRGSASPVWESESNPELSMIAARGPAARAGLRVGDELTHIDGLPITRSDGARRLGAVQPGDKVTLTVRRDGKSLRRSLTLGRRPEARAAAVVASAGRAAPSAPAARAAIAAGRRSELRYTGKIEDVSVEVWSTAGSTVERVGDTMVITVGGTVIRLKADPKK